MRGSLNIGWELAEFSTSKVKRRGRCGCVWGGDMGAASTSLRWQKPKGWAVRSDLFPVQARDIIMTRCKAVPNNIFMESIDFRVKLINPKDKCILVVNFVGGIIHTQPYSKINVRQAQCVVVKCSVGHTLTVCKDISRCIFCVGGWGARCMIKAPSEIQMCRAPLSRTKATSNNKYAGLAQPRLSQVPHDLLYIHICI